MNTIIKQEEIDGYILTIKKIEIEGGFLPPFLNGYLTLPKRHKLEKLAYDNIDVDVHGGLTYSDHMNDISKDRWTIGFDTAHLGDDSLTIQNEEYIWNEILNMKEQLND